MIAVIGISTDLESENRDRKTLDIPVEQEDFIEKVAAKNPHLVVVMESGSVLGRALDREECPIHPASLVSRGEGGATPSRMCSSAITILPGRLPADFLRGGLAIEADVGI